MSGRDHEPVAAFFPSIDRNLIRDLDRHLRSAQPSGQSASPDPANAFDATPDHTASTVVTGSFTPPPLAAPVVPLRNGSRPNIAGVLEAVEHAAHTMASMTARIDDLETQLEASEASHRQIESQLEAAEQHARQLEAKLKTESDRASRFESVAGQQAARTMELERDLMNAHGDLSRVTDAIAAALGYPQE